MEFALYKIHPPMPSPLGIASVLSSISKTKPPAIVLWYSGSKRATLYEATFQQELNDDLFYADVRKKYGSRGVAQAKKIKEQTTALFAGGELSEEDQAAFIKEMEALFLDAKADAKKFTPKKYLR